MYVSSMIHQDSWVDLPVLVRCPPKQATAGDKACDKKKLTFWVTFQHVAQDKSQDLEISEAQCLAWLKTYDGCCVSVKLGQEQPEPGKRVLKLRLNDDHQDWFRLCAEPWI
jgi:hypothetical protein